MKRINKISLVMVGTLAVLGQTGFASTGEGGAVIGSGTDGKGFVIKKSQSTVNVSVPVPPETSILVRGPGNQNQVFGDQFFARKCQVNKKGEILLQGCGSWMSKTLGEKLAVAPGRYQVRYGNTLSHLIPLKRGHQKVIDLKSIEFSVDQLKLAEKVQGQVYFSVFRDLSNESERARLLDEIVGGKNGSSDLSLCSKLYLEVFRRSGWERDREMPYASECRHAGAAWKDEETNGTLRSVLTDRLFPQGVNELDSDGYFEFGWGLRFRADAILPRTTFDPKMTVSVLPGVYGVEFRDASGEVIDRVLGVHVE